MAGQFDYLVPGSTATAPKSASSVNQFASLIPKTQPPVTPSQGTPVGQFFAQIPNSAASSFSTAVQGANEIGAGEAPIPAIESALKIGAGVAGVAFSPIAPITNLIGKAIDYAGGLLSNTQLIKDYAKTATTTDTRVLNDLQNLGGIAMGILGVKAGDIKSSDISPAKITELAQHPDIITAAQKIGETLPSGSNQFSDLIPKKTPTETAPVTSEAPPPSVPVPTETSIVPESAPAVPQTETTPPAQTTVSTIVSRNEAANKPITTGGESVPSKSVTIDNMQEHLSPAEFQAFKDSTSHEKADRVEQANKAASFVNDHPDRADNIIFKGEHPPEGILTQDVFTEARIKALADYRAGKVPLETYMKYVKADELLGSRTGSELGARANRFDVNDPAAWLAKARENIQKSDITYKDEATRTRAVAKEAKVMKETVTKTAAKMMDYQKILDAIKTC